MVRALTLKALAAALDLNKGQLSRESKRGGFPKDMVNGVAYFNAEEVRAWRTANVRQRKEPSAVAGAASNSLLAIAEAAPVASADHPEPNEDDEADEPLAKDDDPFILTLTSGRATALDISRAAMQLASRRVAHSAIKGKIDLGSLDDLKKSLAELRQAETDYIELGERQGLLIDRGTVRAIIGAVATLLVQACGVLENSIATELSLWIADPAVRELPSEERTKKVRDFVAGVCGEVRRQAADGVDAVIDAGIAEETKGAGDAA